LVRGTLVVGLVALLVPAILAAVILLYGMDDQARAADVIIVLGGGQAGTVRRTRHAEELYKAGYAPYILCLGGRPGETGRSEADRCARTARKHGIPDEAIILEEQSLSTEENAIEAARIMRARGWETAIVVSDDFHLWRANWMFEREGIETYTSPANQSVGLRDKVLVLGREIAATGWFVVKSTLGLDATRVDGL
jgi:uncharacterized SAM-binding protein YcdF (DUF218 family)